MATESDCLIGTDDRSLQRQRQRPAASWVQGLLVSVASALLLVALLSLVSTPSTNNNNKNMILVREYVDMEGSSTSKWRYRATQFISFTINTMGGLAAYGECEGRKVAKNGACYLGDFDIAQDVRHRVELVKEILEKLKQDALSDDPEVDQSDHVLKIFAMPEFFWRGPYGAYTAEQTFGDGEHESLLMEEVFDPLTEIIKDQVFADYLFFFGTVISVKDPNGPIVSADQVLNAGKELSYSNFCPIIKGGPDTKRRFMVTKKYISDEDFLSRTILPNPRNFNQSEYKHDDFSDKFIALMKERHNTVINDNVLEINGLKLGIEICLDHRLGALWDNLQKSHKSELVDVLIVTSAGMAIERGPNPVVPGGVVYLCDGTASSAACIRSDHGKFDPDKVCRAVSPDGRKHLPTGGKHYSEFFPISACFDLHRLGFLEGYYSLHQTQGCAYTLKLYGIDVMDEYDFYPPSIEIYPTVDLPTKL